MRQIEALELFDRRPHGIWLGMAVRGKYTVYDRETDQTIPRRVWGRLLDLGDVESRDGWGSTNDKYLLISQQGLDRLARERLGDTEVWYCPNGEWVHYDPKGYVGFLPCGTMCHEAKYRDLPTWAQGEVRLEMEGDDGSD